MDTARQLGLALVLGLLAAWTYTQANAQYVSATPIWGRWGDWGPCTVTCGGGESTRVRRCTNLPPDDPKCIRQRTQACNTDPCPTAAVTPAPEPLPTFPQDDLNPKPEPYMTTGSAAIPETTPQYVAPSTTASTTGAPYVPETTPQYVAPSSATPTTGAQYVPDTTAAPVTEETTVPAYPMVTEWTEWTECTEECGGGTKTRYRNCPTAEAGPMCRDIEILNCNEQPCPVYTPWGEWSDCDVTCGEGTRFRSKVCVEPSYSADCKLFEADICNPQPCPEPTPVPEQAYTEWTDWTICSVTCGVGFRYRVRECVNKDEDSEDCEESEEEVCDAGSCLTEESYALQCGPTDLSAVPYMQKRLSSPAYPPGYSSAVDCMWTIRAPRGHKVKIVVGKFDVQECCEKLTVLEGVPFGMPYRDAKIVTLTGKVENGMSYSSFGNAMTLRLQRDGVGLDGGFVISFGAVEMDEGFRGGQEKYEPTPPVELWWRMYQFIMQVFMKGEEGEYESGRG